MGANGGEGGIGVVIVLDLRALIYHSLTLSIWWTEHRLLVAPAFVCVKNTVCTTRSVHTAQTGHPIRTAQ